VDPRCALAPGPHERRRLVDRPVPVPGDVTDDHVALREPVAVGDLAGKPSERAVEVTGLLRGLLLDPSPVAEVVAVEHDPVVNT
jgi:hypothetical protein